MLQAELKILGGKHQGKVIPLSTRKFLVGREQDCHLRPSSDMVSRHHCVFTIDDFVVRLRDLGSTNGTIVNGEVLRGEVILAPGDHIGIGKMEFELVVRTPVANPNRTPVAAPKAPRPGSGSSGELESVPYGATVEIPVYSGDSNPEINETSFEMKAVAQAAQNTATNLSTDTAIMPGVVPGGYPGYAPIVPQPYPGAMPPAYPTMMPPAYPGVPGYGAPPMGYPGQYQPSQYPPGYGMPAAYPTAPAYPAVQQQYGAPVTVAEPETAVPSSESLGVRLPSPESTGYKAPAPAPAAAPGTPAAGAPAAGGANTTTEKPSTSAADIIKQYMQKRSR